MRSSSEEEAANTVGTLTTIHSASSGGTAAERQSKVTLKREITAFSGVYVVINQFMGSGIFITQSGILNYAGSFGARLGLLGVWRDSGSGWGNVLP